MLFGQGGNMNRDRIFGVLVIGLCIAIAGISIGYGFYKAYRPIPTEACADGTCARPMNRKLMRSILWIATAIVAVAMIFPYLTPYLLSY